MLGCGNSPVVNSDSVESVRLDTLVAIGHTCCQVQRWKVLEAKIFGYISRTIRPQVKEHKHHVWLVLQRIRQSSGGSEGARGPTFCDIYITLPNLPLEDVGCLQLLIIPPPQMVFLDPSLQTNIRVVIMCYPTLEKWFCVNRIVVRLAWQARACENCDTSLKDTSTYIFRTRL